MTKTNKTPHVDTNSWEFPEVDNEHRHTNNQQGNKETLKRSEKLMA